MSGHSKWSTIKHKKALVDAKKGKIFTKLSNTITITVKRSNDGNIDTNPALRAAVEKAREANMPNENIKRAIDKGLGVGGANSVEEIDYEGYGPFGVGVIVKTVTDNRNRTASEIKNILDKSGGSIGSPGSVSYMKNINPIPMISLSDNEKERVKAMLEEIEENEDVVEVWSNLAND